MANSGVSVCISAAEQASDDLDQQLLLALGSEDLEAPDIILAASSASQVRKALPHDHHTAIPQDIGRHSGRCKKTQVSVPMGTSTSTCHFKQICAEKCVYDLWAGA